MSRRRWAQVPGFEGRYDISSSGDVRSVLSGGMLLKQRVNKDGYAEVNLLLAPNKQRVRRVHRLVLEAFVGACPPGMETRHLNGNRLDNRLINLRWGTPSENCRDRREHGVWQARGAQGASHPRAKLTDADVRSIVARAAKVSRAKLAKEYGVSPSVVSRIVNGRAWRSVVEVIGGRKAQAQA